MNFLDPNIFFEIADRYYAQTADLTLLADYLIKYHYEILNIKAICTFSLFDKNYYNIYWSGIADGKIRKPGRGLVDKEPTKEKDGVS